MTDFQSSAVQCACAFVLEEREPRSQVEFKGGYLFFFIFDSHLAPIYFTACERI